MASGQYTSSLMFGVQWDLILKYLESKGVESTLLYNNSSSWGNYTDSIYSIADEDVSYNEINSDTGALGEWVPATTYNHNEGNCALLTTGARSTFGKQNIYDLAGNVGEWTLEYSSYLDVPSGYRAGSCASNGNGPATDSVDYIPSYLSVGYIGFRVSLY